MQDDEVLKNDIDWEARELCNDGNCIGVIGTDGRCKECGLEYDTRMDESREFRRDTPEDSRNNEISTETDFSDEPDEDADDDWENRVLCADESCIGTIGPDGTCNECGKPFSPPAHLK